MLNSFPLLKCIFHLLPKWLIFHTQVFYSNDLFHQTIYYEHCLYQYTLFPPTM